MKENTYRIIIDEYRDYRVQIKLWWFPFIWLDCHGIGNEFNKHDTVKEAERFLQKHKSGSFKTKRKPVKYL